MIKKFKQDEGYKSSSGLGHDLGEIPQQCEKLTVDCMVWYGFLFLKRQSFEDPVGTFLEFTRIFQTEVMPLRQKYLGFEELMTPTQKEKAIEFQGEVELLQFIATGVTEKNSLRERKQGNHKNKMSDHQGAHTH